MAGSGSIPHAPVLIFKREFMNTMSGLVEKMEDKGFDVYEIHFLIDVIWMLHLPMYPRFHRLHLNEYQERIDQAHIEIDFSGYKNKYGNGRSR